MPKRAYKAKFVTLQNAVKELYNAAYWSADRPVDEKTLWEAVRDAAELPVGQSPKPIE